MSETDSSKEGGGTRVPRRGSEGEDERKKPIHDESMNKACRRTGQGTAGLMFAVMMLMPKPLACTPRMRSMPVLCRLRRAPRTQQGQNTFAALQQTRALDRGMGGFVCINMWART